jgi:hypothetical protein
MAELDTTINDSVVSYLEPIFQFVSNLFNSGYGLLMIGIVCFLLIMSVFFLICYLIKQTAGG